MLPFPADLSKSLQLDHHFHVSTCCHADTCNDSALLQKQVLAIMLFIEAVERNDTVGTKRELDKALDSTHSWNLANALFRMSLMP